MLKKNRVHPYLTGRNSEAIAALRSRVDSYLSGLSARTGIVFEYSPVQQTTGLTYTVTAGVVSTRDMNELMGEFCGAYQSNILGSAYLIVPHALADQPVATGTVVTLPGVILSVIGLGVCIVGGLYFSGITSNFTFVDDD